MIETLVIATHNPKKAGEMIQILSARFPQLVLKTLADYEGAPEPDETGGTYAENAIIKAESAAKFTGEWSLADDAGLEVDALDGAPGIYSRRFGGEDMPFPQKIIKMLHLLNEVPEHQRKARFKCCVALANPAGGKTEVLEAVCEGRITREPGGSGGFGYDPIFYLPALDRTMADLTAEEKHQVSHRGKVLKAFGDLFQGMAIGSSQADG